MEKQKNPGHQPERFEVFTELPNGKGFTIKGSDHVFIFNKLGGWYDEYQNYYNQDGQAQQPPSDDEDEDYQHDHIYHDQDPYEDEFQKQYGPSITDHDYQDNYEDHPTPSQLRHLENVQNNLSTLSKYPLKTPLRVQFSNLNFRIKKDQILKHFRSKVPEGILNIIMDTNSQGKFNGEGCFIVKDVITAQKLVKLQGQTFGQRQFYLDIQSVEELLIEPVSKEQLGQNLFINEDDFQPLEQVKFIDSKKAQITANQKKKYLSKTKQQKETDAKQQKQAQQAKQTKVQPAYTWVKYTAEVTMFPKKSSFRDWMTQMKYVDGEHYRSVDKVQQPDTTKRFASLQLRSDVFAKINSKEYLGKAVIFTQI